MGSDHGPIQRLELRLGEQQLDNAIENALAQAGDCLASALSGRLRQASHEPELHVMIDKDRVLVASQSATLREAETGSAAVAPCPLLEEAACESAPFAARALVHALHELLA